MIYNFFYWTGKLGMFIGFHNAVVGHWKLITFLEFLAVASVGVDTIVRYDKFPHREKRMRLFISALLFVLFMTQLIFGVIEMYMRGGVQ